MHRQKSFWVGLGLSLLLVLLAGCGNEEDVVISCGDLEPCSNIACSSCGWPAGSCLVADGDLVSAAVSESGRAPFFVLVDIEILSELQGQNERLCANAEIVIENEDGELLKRDLILDEPVSICTTSPVSGLHTISLLCDEFPTRARYQTSIADSNGSGMWP